MAKKEGISAMQAGNAAQETTEVGIRKCEQQKHITNRRGWLTMAMLNVKRSSELRIASVSHALVWSEVSTASSCGPAPAVRSVPPLSEL